MSQVSESKEWAKNVIQWYEEGYSDAEVASQLRITIKDFYKQFADNAAFAQLVEFGRTLSQAFWESQFRKNLNNKQFNAPLLHFYMKNKYGWADKTEAITTNENLNTDIDSLRGQVMKDVERFIKVNTPELTDAQRLISDMAKAANE